MICISIAQESRRFALVDMLNASRQCDLVEMRLDRFDKAPDFGELLQAKTKPLIMSCRRQRDGGQWQGTEEERLALLRQCIISKADYVEIELDAADQIRKFPPAKRVISYTNLEETPSNIAEIYAEAQTKSPDVIKLTTLARTPEEAWPLVQILAKPPVPTVVTGLGPEGVMLTILGKKIGAPWTYAALERGMESYPSQPTVHDLETVYRYRDFVKGTRLVGVTGFGDREYATVAILNAAFAHLGLSARCVPLSVGNTRLFRKVMEAVKMVGAVVDEENQADILEVAAEREPSAVEAAAADVLLHKADKWHAYHTGYRSAIAALETILRAKTPADNPLNGRLVMIVGVGSPSKAMAQMIAQRGGIIVVASHDKKGGLAMAQALQCRFVQFEAMYSTTHDVLVVCDGSEPTLKPAYLKPSISVLDLTAKLQATELIKQAITRGCSVVTPKQLFLERLAMQSKLFTGKDVDLKVLEAALPARLQEDEEE